MYKVLLADDEKIIRDGIVQFIPWEAFDCIIAFEACNGVQAKEYIGANTVDIAVLDIRMPGIGGLDLAQYILEHCPQTQVIMLTAYTDFHYIQKALRCSVVDYVIKTNFENELPNAIEKAISCISRHQKVCAPSHLVGADSVRLLTETLEGRLCDLSSIGFLSEPYCLTAFRPGIDRSSGMDRMLNAMSLACNAHAASISELIHALFVWNGCTIVLISCPGSILEKVFPVIHACYYSMLTRLDFSLGCKLAGGVSGIKTGAGKLRSACLEALHALNHTGEGIHFYADDDQAHAESYDALQEIAKHIVSGINEGEIDAAYDRLENLFSRFEAQRFPIDSVRTSCIILCSMLTAWSAKNGIFLDNELESMFYSAIRLAGTH
ncbi:MAG TPA: response regulator, partial [Feifaniaceae bacterium]|nr:response regulator [Feifaniaceae bacterium]